MATLKQRLHKKNSGGTYDVVHLETDATVVAMSSSDSTTVANKIDTLQDKISLTAGSILQQGTSAGNIVAAELEETTYVDIPSAPTTTALLKGDGSGGIVAATPGTDYALGTDVNVKVSSFDSSTGTLNLVSV